METQSPPKPQLSETTVAFLNQECERMLSLYSQAQANAQSVFNFYLTFVTAVIGAIVFITQSAPENSVGGRTEGLLLLVLSFAAVVGSVYLPALAGRYAHASRYAFAADEIRRYLIAHLHTTLPDVYESLTKPRRRRLRKAFDWIYTLVPNGTYEVFITFVNSAALSAITWLFLDMAEAAPWRVVIGAAVVFVLSTVVYSIYSHMIINRFGKGLNVYLWDDSPGWSARV